MSQTHSSRTHMRKNRHLAHFQETYSKAEHDNYEKSKLELIYMGLTYATLPLRPNQYEPNVAH
uniref:Uncharacterized protein n=1 Tax=Oryza rufipogon TaxID=4529 RepID=A0A0E0QL48_ORYRU